MYPVFTSIYFRAEPMHQTFVLPIIKLAIHRSAAKSGPVQQLLNRSYSIFPKPMAAERADALVPSVFQALRATLTAQIAASSPPAEYAPQAQPLNEWLTEAEASGSRTKRPLAGNTTVLFAHIAHRHPRVHESTQLHIAEQAQRRVIETIRCRRMASRRVRESAIQCLQQYQTLMANDCRQVLMQAQSNEIEFQQHTTQIQQQAIARLQVHALRLSMRVEALHDQCLMLIELVPRVRGRDQDRRAADGERGDRGHGRVRKYGN